MKKYSDEEMKAILEDYYENHADLASKEVRESYSALNTALDVYISALSDDYFIKGFRYAMKVIDEGGRNSMRREKFKEIVLLLISVNTVEELQEMVKESCWDHYTVEIMLEELKNRKQRSIS